MGIKGYPTNTDGFYTWTETEVAQFEAVHPVGTKARLALELLLGTGQRRSDVVEMGWQHIQGDCITVRQEKTNTLLLIPINGQLATALEALPRTNLTFITTEHGKPFTPASFGNWFKGHCPPLVSHTARHMACARQRQPDWPMPDAPPTRSRPSPATGRSQRWPATLRLLTKPGWPGRPSKCFAQIRYENCPTSNPRLDKTGRK